ncbi:MAG: hypothetical protein EHM28_04760 [Spirochaetaceae bacterium]|nr:MAG: hypothetical protein EHM28_04760 [Spirochaetaceae bacterium]
MNKTADFIYSLSNFDNIENFKKLVNIRTEKGYIVGGDQVREWAFKGFRNENNIQVLYAELENSHEFVSLADIFSLKKEEALSKLLLLARAIGMLSRTPSFRYEIDLDTVFFTPENKVVFLPATLFRKMRVMAHADYSKTHLLINNPYFLKQGERAIWALESLCYRVLAGAFPFEGDTAEQLKDRIRLKGSTSPNLHVPDLKPEIARHFQDFFNSPDLCKIALPHIVKKLETWITEGTVRVLDENQRREIALRLQKEKESREKGHGRKLFWERNWKSYTIGIIVSLAVVILLWIYLATTIFRPRVTAGYIPEKVLDVYFNSLNTLNVTDMGDCVTGDAEKGWPNSLTILAPSTRQFEAMTGRPLTIDAAVWIKAGKPPIDPPCYAFGAVNLVLKEEAGEPDPVFRAEYEMYYRNVDPQNSESKLQYELIYRVKERFYFRKDGRDWVIYKIESLENTLLEKKLAVLE